jgi:hypothetical protein
MSRPKPDVVLVQNLDRDGIRVRELLEAPAIWTVKYTGLNEDGLFVNVRTRNTLLNYPGPKYPRVAFANEGAAHLLCRKLRQQFKDPNFFVFKLAAGEQVEDKNGE